MVVPPDARSINRTLLLVNLYPSHSWQTIAYSRWDIFSTWNIFNWLQHQPSLTIYLSLAVRSAVGGTNIHCLSAVTSISIANDSTTEYPVTCSRFMRCLLFVTVKSMCFDVRWNWHVPGTSVKIQSANPCWMSTDWDMFHWLITEVWHIEINSSPISTLSHVQSMCETWEWKPNTRDACSTIR